VYAIIAVGGKQLKVQEGDTVQVERLAGEVGDTVTLTDVLLVQKDDGALAVGTPTVEGGVVKGSIVNHGRGKKIVIFKHKRRKNYRRKQGHRQEYTALKITDIDIEKKKSSRTKAAKQESEPEESSTESPASED
jgi:large subunit ribosomal protein L21